jgi:hypothetical protein
MANKRKGDSTTDVQDEAKEVASDAKDEIVEAADEAKAKGVGQIAGVSRAGAQRGRRIRPGTAPGSWLHPFRGRWAGKRIVSVARAQRRGSCVLCVPKTLSELMR